MSKIRMYFNQEDAEAIINTRITQSCTRDRNAWIYASNGQYMVKLGYQQWHKSHIGDMGLQHSKDWSRIWRLKVPHMVKIFLWRFCCNNIHVRNLLRHKGVPVPIGCVMCNSDVERLLHLFFDCRFAQDCWQRAGLGFDMLAIESAPEWLLHKLSGDIEDNLVKISTVLYGILFARNKKKYLKEKVYLQWEL